jgi:nucleoside-diphosphate-sugar epimerase
MKIWITGCAGFLGGRLAQRFSSAGHEVVGLSRRACAIASRSVKIDLASSSAQAELEALGLESGWPDVVIHAASKQPGSKALSEYVKSNVLATANLLDALREAPPEKLIYTSTLSVYSEPGANPVGETAATADASPYAATKRWAEQMVKTFQDRSRVVILRLPSLYGAGQVDSFIDGLARVVSQGDPVELFARGCLVRDALYVEDVVEAIASCVTRPLQSEATIINLGCGRRVTTSEYAEALVKAWESESIIVPVDCPVSQFDLYADITKARRLLGFNPRSLEDSMREYRDELRAQS